jgi:hypothetical protein
VFAGVIKDDFICITRVSNISPVDCIDSMGQEVLTPTAWQVFVDDDFHDASSS